MFQIHKVIRNSSAKDGLPPKEFLAGEVLDAPEIIKVTAIGTGHTPEVDGKMLSEGIFCFTHRT